MLRVQIDFPSGVQRFATEDLDYDGQFWDGRIINGFDLKRIFSYSDKTGNRARSISIQLDNNDSFLNTTQADDGLLNQLVTLYYDEGDTVTKL